MIYGSSYSKLKLADVRPIVGPSRIYFVERDVEEQVDHLCKISFDHYGNVIKTERIFKQENEIKIIQLCNDKLMKEDLECGFRSRQFDEQLAYQ